MRKRYPLKFLDAYTKEDKDIFFGREEEENLLYEMIFQTDLLLVYGASGTGKTSLIQCGLSKKFQSHDRLALTVRRKNNLNDSLKKCLEIAGGKINKIEEDLEWLYEDWTRNRNSNKAPSNSSELASQFKALYLKHFKPIHLIFDQFEELYILGSKSEQELFISTVKKILLVKQPVKIIISIREEYLGYLYEFEKQVPELMSKRLRVEAMNLEKVKSVIRKIASYPNGNIHLKKGEEEDIAILIYGKTRGEDKSKSVQLPYLQVFLDRLYLQITNDKSRQKEATFSLSALNEMGDIGDVLRDFLDDRVRSIARKLQLNEENIWKILSPFVTLEGTKEPLSEEQLNDRLKSISPTIIKNTLGAFVEDRVLRFAENEQLYEIAHDSLAKQIKAKRSEEDIALLEVIRLIRTQTQLNPEARDFFSDRHLLFIEPHLNKLNLKKEEITWIKKSQAFRKKESERKEKEIRKTRTQLRIVRFLLIGFVLLSILAIYFGRQANKEKSSAQQSLKNAYQSDINRFDLEIKNAERKIATYKQNNANVDVIELEQTKIDSLEIKIQRLNEEIKTLNR